MRYRPRRQILEPRRSPPALFRRGATQYSQRRSTRKTKPVGERARSRDEPIEPVNQALDAVEDLRAAIEYGKAYVDDNSLIVEPLSNGLADVLLAIRNDEYRSGQSGRFDFLESLRETEYRALPFWPLPRRIIDTHERGYQADGPPPG